MRQRGTQPPTRMVIIDQMPAIDYMLDAKRMQQNLRTWSPNGRCVRKRTFDPYVASCYGSTLHKVAGVMQTAQYGQSRFDRIDAVFVCGESTYHPCFFKRIPRRRQCELRKCRKCFELE